LERVDPAEGLGMSRIYLSPPDVSESERTLLLDAFDSNWIAPLGPHVDAFEHEFAEYLGDVGAVALSSGTAALHLALLVVGVKPGDEVLVPTLTFAATANAVTYVGARPAFIDSDEVSWNLDPALLADELAERSREGRRPAAVIGVDLFGQCADWDAISEVCEQHEVPVIEDAAEALGATYRGRASGTLGSIGTFSFNGNKIMTTSGGGMLVSRRSEWVQRTRHLATQARDPAPHYEHSEIGFNYRLSNLLAAVGRAQLARLPQMVERRREINRLYRAALADLPGLDFMPNAAFGEPSNWLTIITVDENELGASREDLRVHLETRDIEARPVWKPMHLQPAFSGIPVRGGAVAERLFATGLCLPSGSVMRDRDVERVVDALHAAHADVGARGGARPLPA
jgi:dTDP-4-amino-4,6-dideoxygalactose transaminase